MADYKDSQSAPSYPEFTNDEDFNMPCSDDEMAMKDGVEWEPKPNEIIELLEALDERKILDLDWKCPERRPLTPMNSSDHKYIDSGKSEPFEDKSGFEFEDDSSPMKLPQRPSGSETGPRGSAKKKTTNLDDILSNMIRHRKLDMMEDDDEDALPL